MYSPFTPQYHLELLILFCVLEVPSSIMIYDATIKPFSHFRIFEFSIFIRFITVLHFNHRQFELSETGESKYSAESRGIGTDVAIGMEILIFLWNISNSFSTPVISVSSMVFLAQFLLSCFMGQIVSYSQTTTAVCYTAAFLAFCGAISATNIMYLDL